MENEDVIAKGYDSVIMGRLLRYLRPHARAVALAFCCMLLVTLSSLAGPYLVKIAIDAGILAGSWHALLWAVIGYVGANLVQWLARRAQIFIMAEVGQKTIYAIRMELFGHLQRMSLRLFDDQKVGVLMSRVTSDVNVLQEMVTWAIIAMANNLLTIVGIVVAMVSLNVRLALVTMTVLPLMGVATNIWRLRAREAYREIRRVNGILLGTLEETISGVRVIQAFSREEHNSRHFREVVNQDYFDANVHAAWLSAIFFPTVDFIGYAAVAIVVAVGGMAVLGQTLTAGVLVAFILYIERFFDPIRELAQRYNTLQATMAAGERIFHLLDTEPDIITSPGAIRLPRIRGHVRFENVYFSYDEQVPVLQGINLEVLPGQMVAFVGATGAGKSSLVKLLGRFYDIQSGRLTIDGYDVRDVDLASLRSQMGIVLQETFLFGGTVMDNIRYGRLDASDEEVMDAAKAVGAHEFIQSLSHGYYTEVEEGGAILSVGQRQLLAFARALLADPRIIILDEATSSIDTKTERLIQAAMGRLLAGRTAFVVAHRLSTIVHADQIVVLDQGRIVEQGTHAELIMRRGLYYRLYTMSFQHFSVPTAALGKAEDGNGRQTGS